MYSIFQRVWAAVVEFTTPQQLIFISLEKKKILTKSKQIKKTKKTKAKTKQNKTRGIYIWSFYNKDLNKFNKRKAWYLLKYFFFTNKYPIQGIFGLHALD